MAKTADAKEGQYVVVHDMVSFRDPDDRERGVLKRDEMTFLNASRGQELPEGVGGREIERALELGAIAEAGSDEAELAKRGLPRSAPGSAPGIALGRSQNEETQVMKATLAGTPGPAGPNSSIAELVRLPGENLAVMARVLGIEVTEDATKHNLAEAIVGKVDGATSQEEIDRQRQTRDERQVAARDFGGEAGLVGANVRSDGRTRAGERTADAETDGETAEAKASGGRRGSRSSGSKSEGSGGEAGSDASSS